MRASQEALRKLDDLRLRTARAETEALTRGMWDESRLSADYKGNSFVALAAILEALFRQLAPELRSSVRARCLAPDPLRCEMAALVARKYYARAGQNDREGLLQRVRRFAGVALTSDDWPEEFQFADGRTVDAILFDAVWAALALDGPSMPSANHRRGLDEIKDLRNRVAHGEEEAPAVGGRKTYQDVYRRIEQLAECIEALDTALDVWLARRGWAL